MYMLLYHHTSIIYPLQSEDNLPVYPVRQVIRTDLPVWVLIYITVLASHHC